jgi:hypothetical protein
MPNIASRRKQSNKGQIRANRRESNLTAGVVHASELPQDFYDQLLSSLPPRVPVVLNQRIVGEFVPDWESFVSELASGYRLGLAPGFTEEGLVMVLAAQLSFVKAKISAVLSDAMSILDGETMIDGVDALRESVGQEPIARSGYTKALGQYLQISMRGRNRPTRSHRRSRIRNAAEILRLAKAWPQASTPNIKEFAYQLPSLGEKKNPPDALRKRLKTCQEDDLLPNVKNWNDLFPLLRDHAIQARNNGRK